MITITVLDTQLHLPETAEEFTWLQVTSNDQEFFAGLRTVLIHGTPEQTKLATAWVAQNRDFVHSIVLVNATVPLPGSNT